MPIIFTKKPNKNITKASDLITGSFNNSQEYYSKILDSITDIEKIEVEVINDSLDLAINIFNDVSQEKTIYLYLKEKVASFYDEIKDELEVFLNSYLVKDSHKNKTRLFGLKASFKNESFMDNYEAVPLEACVSFESRLPNFELDESFSEALIRTIDEKGLKDPEVYKKANMDRKLFNHIKNDKDYKPRKETCIALCMALELNFSDFSALLAKAGYVLSRSNLFDLIIRYCLENQIYDINKINELLFEKDQRLLG